MKKLVVFAALALFGAMASPARAYTHPCIPFTTQDLDYIKANLNRQPWKSGYDQLAATSTARLDWAMEGPYANVSRAGSYDQNLSAWQNSMNAVYNLARMWYFTGNSAYAQKAHDILLAWATTHVSFTGNESGLALGDHALAFGGGASILRGTWPGWTAADTTTVQNYFRNVLGPATLGWGNILGPANKGAIYSEAAIAIAVFCDDTAKFNQIVNLIRTYHGAGLTNTLPTGQMGETGRDQGHAWGHLNGLIFTAEVAWKQGVDLFGEMDNRLLACGEYYARNAYTTDNPFVPFGTVDWQWTSNHSGPITPGGGAFSILKNAYTYRKGLPTPWIDRKLQEQPVDFMFYKTSDTTTATVSPVSFPTVSPASSGLTLTTLGTQTANRSVTYANGTWTMTGLGSGTWTDGADDCQFAYTTMTGDCAMVAKINSFTYSGSNNGKAGLMIRDNLAATVGQRAWIGALPAATMKMESHMRGWTENWGGGGYAQRSHDWPSGLPYWVKIERRDKQITTFASIDGTSWSPLNCSYYGNLPSTLHIGLFVCSGNTTAVTATFSNVAFTGGTGGLVTSPAAPAGLIVSGSSKAVTTRWLPSFGATSYMVLRSTNNSTWSTIASGLSASTTSYVDTTTTAGTTYYYAVRAINSAGSGTSASFAAARPTATFMVNLAHSGTAMDSANNAANAASAFDENCWSQWFYSGTSGWLQYDFGANNAQVVKRYTVTEAITIPARDPKDWQFQGSQDGSNWTTLDTQSGQSFAYTYQQLTFNLSNTTAYRYYRINVTANNGDPTFLHIGELGLWGDSGRTIPDGRYILVSRKSNKVIDAKDGGTANGTVLHQWSYLGTSNQKWDVAHQSNGQYIITGVGSGRVMDVKDVSTANGAQIHLWDWLNNNNQKWTVTPAGDGSFKITAVHSGKVVDVSGGSTANGAKVQQWDYLGGENQEWRMSTVAP
jgi:hypothetical protein